MFTTEQNAKLLEALGLPEDTTDAELVLATAADMSHQASGNEPTPSAVAAAAKRQGLDVVDADTLAILRQDAAEGRQIKAAAERQKVEGAVEDAINKGKITAARKKHWVDLITADPGMADVLAGVPNETAVPMTEIGHSLDSDGQPGQPSNEGWFY